MAQPTDLELAEWDLWSEFTDKMDNLHREATRLDRTGRLGYVYLAEMQIEGQYDPNLNAHIKIGRSRNPEHRIREWSRTNVTMPYTIRQQHVFWCENAPLVESYFHRLFSKYREAGEWFWLPWDYQHAFYGLWYVSTYGDAGDKMQFRDTAGGWHDPLEFFRHEIREHRRMAQRSREAYDQKIDREREAES